MYDVQSVGAKSYLSVAQELLRRADAPDNATDIALPHDTARATGEVHT
jgi:hypothetical protein